MQVNQSLKRRISKNIGNAIILYRGRRNMSQEELAFNIGVDRTYISAIEKGKKCASVYCLYLLAEALNIPLRELVDF